MWDPTPIIFACICNNKYRNIYITNVTAWHVSSVQGENAVYEMYRYKIFKTCKKEVQKISRLQNIALKLSSIYLIQYFLTTSLRDKAIGVWIQRCSFTKQMNPRILMNDMGKLQKGIRKGSKKCLIFIYHTLLQLPFH